LPQGVLSIFAHPDDESLVAGATLAACAAAGLEVIIISLTRGEQGPIANSTLASRESIGDIRESELRTAGNILGAAAVECLSYPDGALSWEDETGIKEVLAEIIRKWQPGIVITFGPEGLYWHPDHVATHKLTTKVTESLRIEGISPWVYYATWPEGHITKLTRILTSRKLDSNSWGLSPDAFGAPPQTITTCLDVRRYLDVKLRALGSHRTQLTEDNLFRAMPQDLAEEFLGREFFVRAYPAKTGLDRLEEIVNGSVNDTAA
jgi:LmbE family N-acetylglucosaminyl deacetylase